MSSISQIIRQALTADTIAPEVDTYLQRLLLSSNYNLAELRAFDALQSVLQARRLSQLQRRDRPQPDAPRQ